MTHPLFSFETEFAPDGAILSGPARTYVSRDEADQHAAKARAEGEANARMMAEARAATAVDKVLTHLSPAREQIAQIADELRREAAELAMAAARKIAGDALDAHGAQTAAAGVAEAVRLLKGSPIVYVSAAPDALPEIERRLDQLRRQRGSLAVEFIPDGQAKPGDWRVEWSEGVAAFSRDDVEAAIAAVVAARLQDPVEPQLDLFSAA